MESLIKFHGSSHHQPDHDLTSKNGGMAWSGWGHELSPLTLMGDLQDPTDGGTLAPYSGPYFVGIFPEI